MSNLVRKGSKYTDQQRMEVVLLYAISGNAKKVAKDTGIPRTTIVGWKKTDWWQDAVMSVRSEKADEHRAKYSELVDKAQQVALEKLPEASARDAMIIAATGTDKIRLADNMPTTITGKAESMNALAAEFKALSAKWDEKQANVVAVQDESEETE
jgi:hypothetical protein